MTTDAADSRRDDRRRIADLERLLEVARRLGATVDLDLLLKASAPARIITGPPRNSSACSTVPWSTSPQARHRETISRQ